MKIDMRFFSSLAKLKISFLFFLLASCLISSLPLHLFLGFEKAQWCLAASIFICFIFFFLWVRATYFAQHKSIAIAPHNQDDIIYIVYASQTGYAEQVAIQTHASLQQVGQASLCININACDAVFLQQAKRIVWIVSTTGEGDAPDSAAQFTQNIMSQRLALKHIEFAVLALGDSHYQHFCAFGHQLNDWLKQQQARAAFDLIEVDNADEGTLRHWLHQLSVFIGHTEIADWQAPEYQHWTLIDRRLLNAGSAGKPVYLLSLQNKNAQWQAGDILEVLPEANPESFDKNQVVNSYPHREYSIASISQDGQVDLIVRQMQQEDGSLGIGSGWLTKYTAIGGTVQCRIRKNQSFHADNANRPMIFIGNGTGIAGLRAHIQQREKAGLYKNWLFFGERNRAHDFLLQEEIQAWQSNGIVERVDLAFSRDHEARIYVQDKMKSQALDIALWVEAGAAIYVCGSLHGMASGVESALIHILGEHTLNELRKNNLYKRDVY